MNLDKNGSLMLWSSLLCMGLLSGTRVVSHRPEPVLTTSRPEYFPMPSTESSSLPFSEAVRSGSTLYVSGQIGTFPDTLALVPGGIVSEAPAALDNLKAILDRHGSSLEQVVKWTAFLADIKSGRHSTKFIGNTSKQTSRRAARSLQAGLPWARALSLSVSPSFHR